ncbi:hypothetical protein FA95DRAFT_637990 [Auriscalpium vulgare]|uniref:Uncharacterized protein n=1 Tax=Auriscalpium vulgare TaxID=40419 RepID=A0ACB8RCV1_9AGAM|nr:hypothetical protein FA95DRAFT_637990 [Auriscalpium vulgare]
MDPLNFRGSDLPAGLLQSLQNMMANSLAGVSSFSVAGVSNVRDEGMRLLKAARYADAREKFLAGVNTLVGDDVVLPQDARIQGGVRLEKYSAIDHHRLFAVMGLCDDIAQCCLGSGEVEKALAWLEEVNVICKNAFIQKDPPVFEPRLLHPPPESALPLV